MESNDDEQLLRSTLHRYMTKELAEAVLNSTADPRGAMPKEVSILFTHVFNYNSLAESLSLQALHALLNQLFELLVDEVGASQLCNEHKYLGF